MKQEYFSAFDKIKATDDFKNETVSILTAQAEENEKERKVVGIYQRRRFVTVLAASLAVVIALSAFLFIPRHSGRGFTVTASAEENGVFSPLRDDVSANIGSFEMDGGGGYSNFYDDDYFFETQFFKLDIRVKGDDIEKITYSMDNGRVLVSDDSEKIIDFVGKTARWDVDGRYPDQGSYEAGEHFYQSVTCSYDDQFTLLDDSFKICFGTTGKSSELDRDDFGISKKMISSDKSDLATREEVKEHYDSLFAKYFDNDRLNITVSYKDGRVERQTVRFSTDTSPSVYESKSVYYLLNPKSGEYKMCQSYDEWLSLSQTPDSGFTSGGGADVSVIDGDVLSVDENGVYHLKDVETGGPVGEQKKEFEITFTEDDIFTLYQWGVNYNLTARLV